MVQLETHGGIVDGMCPITLYFEVVCFRRHFGSVPIIRNKVTAVRSAYPLPIWQALPCSVGSRQDPAIDKAVIRLVGLFVEVNCFHITSGTIKERACLPSLGLKQ